MTYSHTVFALLTSINRMEYTCIKYIQALCTLGSITPASKPVWVHLYNKTLLLVHIKNFIQTISSVLL